MLIDNLKPQQPVRNCSMLHYHRTPGYHASLYLHGESISKPCEARIGPMRCFGESLNLTSVGESAGGQKIKVSTWTPIISTYAVSRLSIRSASTHLHFTVRVRPWHPEKEIPFITQPSHQTFFLGDGNFGCSPRKPPAGSLRGVVGAPSPAICRNLSVLIFRVIT